MAKLNVAAVVPVRNEERFLPRVLRGLRRQTLRLSKIVVVDDGSADSSAWVAERFRCHVVRLPFHPESYVGRPELAVRFNAGLRLLADDVDYCLIVGGDTLLPPDYVERVVDRMGEHDLVVSGGRISGEFYSPLQVRGQGRIVDMSFWRGLNGGLYPVCYGFEGWLSFKALEAGRRIGCFSDIVYWTLRHTGHKRGEQECWGRAMYVLGYNWKTALARCFRWGLKNPVYGLFMLRGWLCRNGLERSSVADWVNGTQHRRFKRRLMDRLARWM